MNFSNLIFLLLFGFTPFIASATIVKGTSPYKANVKLYFALPESGYEQEVLKSAVDMDGSFYFEFNHSSAVRAFIIIGPEKSASLFLVPGDTLSVEFDIIDSDSLIVHFKGGEALGCQLLKEEEQERSAFLLKNYCSPRELPNLHSECWGRYDQFRLDRYHKIWLPSNVHPSFKNYIYQEILYSIATKRILYPMFHAYNLGMKTDSGIVDSDYYSFLDTILIENPEDLDIPEYRSFTGYYVWNYILSEQKRKGFEYNQDSLYPILFDITDSVFTGEIACYQKTRLVELALQKTPHESIQLRYQKLLKDCAGTPYAERARKNYRKVVMLKPGNVPPAIVASTINNDTFDLSAYAGKTVVLDFWASWCAPCIMDMSNFRMHKEELLKEDVVFVYVSIDENEAQWRNSVEMLEIEGIHLRVSGIKSPIAEAYNISGIPKTFLINKHGKIADPNPPHDPDELKEAIRALNAE
ncbi:MAG: TlpA disulfide reductase family protein [Bacteroidia bacterium]